jgi:PAS domain S-box-containing protein
LSAAKNTALNVDVAKMAAVMGVRAPTGGSFIEQMTAVFDQLPHAMVIVDMELPGVRQMYVNAADERLTGYPKAEQLGRNCRFLQGQRTEAAAVRQMVRCIRDRAQSTLRVTNYRKDGSAFSNILTLHPIVDSEGTYRYQVGVLSDASNEASEGPALQRLRAALPSVFDVSQQPRSRQYAEAVSTVSSDAQQAQWRASLAKFTRLVWSLDWEGALRSLCTQPEAMSMFGRWCTEKAPEDAMHLELLVLTAQLSKVPPAQQQQQAIALCERYLQKQHTDGAAAFAELAAQAGAALTSIASTSFPKFVQSKACLPLVESLVGSAAGSLRSAKKLIWDEYEVPPDLAGWVHSFVQVAETYPACIVLSDMSIPGNPMFFVNREFARVTGYAKDEAQGRNCRFLQGPKTEPQSVAVIQDTLRRGVDCHVKITNYRKSGEIFENLLTMRPVHDSNGVYRLCIGVQFEITRDMSLKTRLLKLERLIKLLPTTIEVSSATAQPTHMRMENEAEQRTELDVKLESALQGATVGAQATEHRLDETAHYDDNRDEMLRHLKMSRR